MLQELCFSQIQVQCKKKNVQHTQPYHYNNNSTQIINQLQMYADK